MRLNNNLTTQLTANEQKFQFGYDTEKDKYGYIVKVDGADTFFPFSQGIDKNTVILNNGAEVPSDGWIYGIYSIYVASGNGGWGVKYVSPQGAETVIVGGSSYNGVTRINLESEQWFHVQAGGHIQHYGWGNYKGTCIFIPD